uniref:DNA ligase 4 n=2 Tax=Anthurium amnicola TaxID=1678845 RepID=A0A1D1Z6M6_9ARAE
MGLAERSTSDSYPKRFISFCRVGSGLSDDELDSLVNKLKPHFRRNEYPRKSPRFYEVTYNAKERPDVWVDSPDKSIILSITSDIRTIKSEVFAAPYSLRFPRIDRVRYDKPWHDCLDVQSFMELVHSSNGSTQRGDLGISQDRISKNVKSSKKSGKNVPVVPAHLKKTDVSDIKGDTLIFASMMFYFANIPSSYSLDYFHKLVAENGGTFSMNSNDSVTHCIAAEKKGIKYRAAARRGDIIHYSWVLDCCVQKHLLHLQPKYFLFIAESSKRKLQDEIDLYSDYYYWDIDLTDLKQMFSNMEGSRDVELVRHYKKYCPTKSWCLFQDCCFYFCEAIPVVNMDHKVTSEVALKRMKLDVVWRGGEVSNDLSHATHLVAYSTSLSEKLFDIIYECCPSEERYILHGQRLHVVSHLWLEDSMDKNDRLPEDAYNLRPDGVVELNIEASAQDSETLALAMDRVEKQRHGASLDGERAKKRGRPAKMDTTKRRAVARPARTRARIRNQPAKLSPDESDTSVPSDENIRMNDADINVPHGMQEMDDIKVEHEISGHSDHMHETIHNKGKGIFQDDKGQGCPEATVAIPSSAKNNALDDRNLRRSDGAVSMEEEKIGTAGKHEIMYDPVQAMLLDMIPSLSQKTIETGKTVLGEKQKPETDTIHTNPVKKKVSYKDVAGQLLGDF